MSAVWVGFLAFFVVSVLVGVRLLLLWRRTRQLPELLMGIGVLGIGPVGFGLAVAGSAQMVHNPPLGHALLGTAQLGSAIGVWCKCLFNARVYHADQTRFRYLLGAVAGLLVVLFLYQLADDAFAHVREPTADVALWRVVQSGALLWGAIEAMVYWRRMRRRQALGFGDPVVANRFLLWGIGAGAAGTGTFVATLLTLVSGLSSSELPVALAVSSTHGLVAAVALALAFVPPAAYTDWIARRAESPGQ